ncbi:hypothetical protein OS493_008443 [Desmophyllum pertusum]|uniref:Uncharacterized protein n=1 Tax=Desmophyllum pertusum TaxID=174260 RepID=A0A9X0A502_9CNID|nr:hypothetical protein OS493_008443 [Desmophyllum pertusum]
MKWLGVLLLALTVVSASNPEENVQSKNPNLMEGDMILSKQQIERIEEEEDIDTSDRKRGSIKTDFGRMQLSSMRFNQVSLAIPVQVAPLEQQWQTGPGKHVSASRRETENQLMSTSNVAEDVHHTWEELADAKTSISPRDAGALELLLMKLVMPSVISTNSLVLTETRTSL